QAGNVYYILEGIGINANTFRKRIFNYGKRIPQTGDSIDGCAIIGGEVPTDHYFAVILYRGGPYIVIRSRTNIKRCVDGSVIVYLGYAEAVSVVINIESAIDKIFAVI